MTRLLLLRTSTAAAKTKSLFTTLTIFALLWGNPSISAHAQEASFACAKASRAVEKLICSQAALRWNDLAMARNYAQAVAATRGDDAKRALRAEQRDWIRERDRRCIADRSFLELSSPNNPLSDLARDCLEIVYHTRRRALEDLVHPPITPLLINTVDLSPITKSRPKAADAAVLPITAAQFSPDSTILALSLPSLELDFPDQAWLFRSSDLRLLPATPAPDRQDVHPDGSVAVLQALAWEGNGTLYARVSLWGGQGERDPNAVAVYAATMNGSHRLPQPSPNILALLDAAQKKAAPIPQQEIPEDYRDAPEMVRGNQQFIVWADDLARGTIQLKMRERHSLAADYLVAWGSWELADYLFDEKRSLLLYAGDTGITVFNMLDRSSRHLNGTGRGDIPLAISADQRMLAWSSRNKCGDEFLSPPDDTAPARLCVAQLPAWNMNGL